MHVREMCSVCGHGKMTFISHFLMNEGLSQLRVALEKKTTFCRERSLCSPFL